jgi:predicted RNase H-like HicB family nuclease
VSAQPEHHHYSMLIQWSDEDQAYIVTVPELAGCRTHGFTYEEAVQRGQEAIEGWIEDARAWGEAVPAPRIFAGAERLSL